MILVVNLNLTIDHTIRVGQLRPGGVHRIASSARAVGGKGVNAARVLRVLGESAVVCGFIGGRAGSFIAKDALREGITLYGTEIRQESRTCLIIDEDHRQQTVLNEAGPAVTALDFEKFSAGFSDLVKNSSLVMICGSLPPGLPPDSYANLIRSAHQAGKLVLLDTTCAALRQALSAAPDIVKVNYAEAAELLEQEVTGLEGAINASDALIARGAVGAMITLGQAGAVFNTGRVKYYLQPPIIVARNTVGCGDAAMAGLAAGMRRGLTEEATGKLAVGAGAANALHGMGRCTAEEITRATGAVVCEILS